jgi:hypothetical protein
MFSSSVEAAVAVDHTMVVLVVEVQVLLGKKLPNQYLFSHILL